MKGEPLCVCSNPGSGTCRDSLNVAGTYLLIGFPKVRRILNSLLVPGSSSSILTLLVHVLHEKSGTAVELYGGCGS